jgi:hypothetical protein
MSVRLLLPYSMGSEVYVNPMTFEPAIDHPILDIGSSYSSVKQPIMQWCAELWGNRVSMGFNGDDYYIDFPTESDLNWFKLRWLS